MTPGLERAPFLPIEPLLYPQEPSSRRLQDSALAYMHILGHIEQTLGVFEGEEPSTYTISQDALHARQQQLDTKRGLSHHVPRGVHELGKLVLGTVKQMEQEFTGSRVLDIGCRDGTFGQAIARNAKANVTFLDPNTELLRKVPRKSGTRIVSDVQHLPFAGSSFDKTVTDFSSLAWANTPVAALRALTEAIRVTRVGGTVFAIPLFTDIIDRSALASHRLQHNIAPTENERLANEVWAAQDYVLARFLANLAADQYCDITWSCIRNSSQTPRASLELYSAIIDIKKPIPPEKFTDMIAIAEKFSSSPHSVTNDQAH